MGVYTDVKGFLSLLFPPVAFSLAYSPIAQFESKVVGVQWNNIGTEIDNWSVKLSLVFLTIATVGYALLGIWLDQVSPGWRPPLSLFFACERAPVTCITL